MTYFLYIFNDNDGDDGNANDAADDDHHRRHHVTATKTKA